MYIMSLASKGYQSYDPPFLCVLYGAPNHMVIYDDVFKT